MQRDVPSDRPHLPYALSLIFQAETVQIEPGFQIIADGPFDEFGANRGMHMSGRPDPKVLNINRFGKIAPEAPFVVTLYSKEHRRVVMVEKIVMPLSTCDAD